MRMRSPLGRLFLALTLFGGAGATLAGCGDPVDSGTGTTNTTTTTTTTSSVPKQSDASQGNLPDNSNREPSSSRTEGDAGNG
jgi:hypothetical protein